MTYDTQGRRVLQGHPSTWPQEVEQLRARVQELEAALMRLSTAECFGDGAILGQHLPGNSFGREIVARMNFARAALEATTAPHSATHSAKPDPGKGQAPETP